MLVLSRKVGERILIGDNITIVVVRCSGDKVRIGIEAPKEVKVIREELKDDAWSSAGAPVESPAVSPAKRSSSV